MSYIDLRNQYTQQSYQTGMMNQPGRMTNPNFGAAAGAAGTMLGGAVGAIDASSGSGPSVGGSAASGALMGAGTGAMIGSVVPGIGTAVGAAAGTVIGGAAGLAKGISGKKEAERQEFLGKQQRLGNNMNIANQQRQQRFANRDMSEFAGLNNFEFGGYLNGDSPANGFRKYNGESHEDSKYEGIPVDQNGEPSIMSGEQPVGLAEGNEVKYTFKDKNTYIFSDKY